jgi:hypothetical protein
MRRTDLSEPVDSSAADDAGAPVACPNDAVSTIAAISVMHDPRPIVSVPVISVTDRVAIYRVIDSPRVINRGGVTVSIGISVSVSRRIIIIIIAVAACRGADDAGQSAECERAREPAAPAPPVSAIVPAAVVPAAMEMTTAPASAVPAAAMEAPAVEAAAVETTAVETTAVKAAAVKAAALRKRVRRSDGESPETSDTEQRCLERSHRISSSSRQDKTPDRAS